MKKQIPIDAAEVFAIVAQPRYNALRLHLTTDKAEEIRFNTGAAEGERPVGGDDNADMVRGSE